MVELAINLKILYIHLMVILVRILIALINKMQFKNYYEYVASSIILLGTYLIYHQFSKKQKPLLEDITKVKKLIQLSVIGCDLWIISMVA